MFECVCRVQPGQNLPPVWVPTGINQEEQNQNMPSGCSLEPAITDALRACG